MENDGEVIETTPEHPFYTAEGEWVPAGELKPGGEVRKVDGTFGVIRAMVFVSAPQAMYNLTVANAHTFFVGQGQWLVHNCFTVQGRLKRIWDDPRLFLNWLKGNASESRRASPLSYQEAQQIIDNARRLGITPELNPVGLLGKEVKGRWAGIPHFRIGNIHIPVQPGFRPQ